MAQAEETWLEGNHVAASCGGMPRMKICEIATIVCPPNITGKWVRPVAKTLIQEPRHVPREPRSTESRRPYGIKYPLGKDRFLTLILCKDSKEGSNRFEFYCFFQLHNCTIA